MFALKENVEKEVKSTKTEEWANNLTRLERKWVEERISFLTNTVSGLWDTDRKEVEGDKQTTKITFLTNTVFGL